MGTLIACLDATLRRIGGAPTYLLTDNAKTVTVEHVAGIAVRHPKMVAAGRHYGCRCTRACRSTRSPRAASEATVRIAKADLVPDRARTCAAPTDRSPSWSAACEAWCEQVNARSHRETGAGPGRAGSPPNGATCTSLPAEPHAAALGEERLVNDDQTVRFGSVRYSTPPGLCRRPGVVPGRRRRAGRSSPRTGCGDRSEIARHRLSTPGNPRIVDAHYPDHPGGNAAPARPGRGPAPKAEAAFLGIGAGAGRWLVEAAAPARSGSGRRWPARSSSPPSSGRRQGRPGARPGRRRRPVRRRRPGLDPGPPGRQQTARDRSCRRDPLRPARHRGSAGRSE